MGTKTPKPAVSFVRQQKWHLKNLAEGVKNAAFLPATPCPLDYVHWHTTGTEFVPIFQHFYRIGLTILINFDNNKEMNAWKLPMPFWKLKCFRSWTIPILLLVVSRLNTKAMQNRPMSCLALPVQLPNPFQ